MTNYEQLANDFLTKTGTTLTVEFLKNGKHFEDDKENRDIYKCTLTRGKRSYTFNFGQSIAQSIKNYCKTVLGTPPTPYDILSCLQKYEVGTFENFCGDFGYDTDSIKALKVYEAVKDEYLNIARLFNEDELEQLQEIN